MRSSLRKNCMKSSDSIRPQNSKWFDIHWVGFEHLSKSLIFRRVYDFCDIYTFNITGYYVWSITTICCCLLVVHVSTFLDDLITLCKCIQLYIISVSASYENNWFHIHWMRNILGIHTNIHLLWFWWKYNQNICRHR